MRKLCRPALSQRTEYREKLFTKRCGFSAGNPDRRRRFFHQPEQLKIDLEEMVNVIVVLGRLTAHQAVAVAPLSHKERVVAGVGSIDRPDKSTGFDDHNVVVPPVIVVTK